MMLPSPYYAAMFKAACGLSLVLARRRRFHQGMLPPPSLALREGPPSTMTLAARYGDRVAMLSSGQIVDEGAPADVLTADAIAEIFGARVRVLDDPGGPVIVPVASAVNPR